MSFRLLKLSLAAGAVAACIGAPAFAAEQEGWYLGAGVGYAKNTLSNVRWFADTSEKTNDAGFKVYGGYQFNKNWAAEIEAVSLGKYTADSPNLHSSVKTSGLGVSAIGMLPLSEQFSLLGKLGVLAKFTDTKEYDNNSSYNYSQKKTSAAALLGFGAEYRFTPDLALRAEYEYFGKSSVGENDSKVSNGLLSVGMRYSF
jgi:OOP family OmpA-OmpF porin